MRKRQRLAFFAIGGLGLVAAVAPGLTAGIGVPENATPPAAGQGVIEAQGFIVSAIDWVVDDATLKVTTVTFVIKRDGDTSDSTVVANEAGTTAEGANAVVRVRLEESDGGNPAAWQGCAVDGTAPNKGKATCTMPSGAQMLASDLGQVNIIAFDNN
jgi:hypothetical protein